MLSFQFDSVWHDIRGTFWACISKLLWSPPCRDKSKNFSTEVLLVPKTFISMVAPLRRKVHRPCPSSHKFHAAPDQLFFPKRRSLLWKNTVIKYHAVSSALCLSMPYRYDFIPGAMDHKPGAVSPMGIQLPQSTRTNRAVTLQKLGQGTLDSKHHLGWFAANYK